MHDALSVTAKFGIVLLKTVDSAECNWIDAMNLDCVLCIKGY